MATIGGTDLSGVLKAIQQGVGDLIGGFRPETTNAALEGLGGQKQTPDLWSGLQYGNDPLLGYQAPTTPAFGAPYGGAYQGPDLWADVQYSGGGGGVNWGGASQGPDLYGGWLASKGKSDQAAQAEQQRQAAAAAIANGGATGGTGGSYDNERDKFEQYRPWIQTYAQQYGIDPDALAAILWIETDGQPNLTSPAGAQGLGQFMPGTWAGYGQGGDPFNPEHAIRAAANYFSTLYKQFGRYDLAAAAYQGGPGAIVNGAPRNDVSDGNLTPLGYSQAWQANYSRIKSTAPQQAAGGATMAGITPGVQGAIMQEFGSTPYAQEHPDTYAYANAYGLQGAQHPGIDWAVPLGSQVATPLGGTVFVVGNDHGTGYYYTNTMSQSDPNRSGEFAVMLDNGDVLILGHLSQINVSVGQRVNAGQLIGLSGGSDGAHVHVEYRKRNANGGFTIVDPRQFLR